MPDEKRHRIAYARGALEHLHAVPRRLHRLIRDAAVQHLAYEPVVVTRNRKPLRDPNAFGSGTWELRFGPANALRLYYQVDEQSRTVYVKGVGRKVGSKLQIGDEEVVL